MDLRWTQGLPKDLTRMWTCTVISGRFLWLHIVWNIVLCGIVWVSNFHMKSYCCNSFKLGEPQIYAVYDGKISRQKKQLGNMIGQDCYASRDEDSRKPRILTWPNHRPLFFFSNIHQRLKVLAMRCFTFLLTKPVQWAWIIFQDPAQKMNPPNSARSKCRKKAAKPTDSESACERDWGSQNKTGWSYTYPSENCYIVSWDYEIPDGKIIQMFQTTNPMTKCEILRAEHHKTRAWTAFSVYLRGCSTNRSG